jgi:signal transduction histidine kinase
MRLALHSATGGRRLLFAGFGGLVLLILLAGSEAILVLRQIRTQDALVRDTYFRRSRAIDEIRAGIYQSAIVMRDYLLASDPHAGSAQIEWTSIRQRTDSAISAFQSALDPEEAAPFRTLRLEIEAYWNVLDFMVQRQPKSRKDRGSAYFSGDLVRRRNGMLALIDRIDQISARELSSGDAKLNATFDKLQFRLLMMLLITLGAGLLLAAFTIRRTLALESELKRRYDEGLKVQQELKELSARLVSAQEEERRAISRELHDEVGQSLSALLMEAGNAAARVPPESDEVRKHVESIKRLAEASVNIIRNMTLLLRPSMLDDFGLVPALEWQAREVSKRTGLRVHVTAEEAADELPDELRTCIYRIVQEALHNCARHSQAKAVKVIVKQERSRIVLSVEDDGRGFDARRVRGLGLVGMEERVTHLGGLFVIDSKPGGGTRVAVELPIAS